MYVLYCRLLQQEIDLKGFWTCMLVTNFSVAQVHRKVLKPQCTFTELHQYLVIQRVSAVHTQSEVDRSHIKIYIYIFYVCVYIYPD